jgi:hypothetical protein
MQDQLRQAASLIKSGNKTQARQIISTILKAEPNNADAWYLNAVLVEGRDSKIQALERAVAINPAHEAARKALNQLRPDDGDPFATPSSVSEPQRRQGGGTGLMVIAFVILVLLVIADLFVIINQTRQQVSAQPTAVVSIITATFPPSTATMPPTETPEPSRTPPPTQTPIKPTATPVAALQAQKWDYLIVDYTSIPDSGGLILFSSTVSDAYDAQLAQRLGPATYDKNMPPVSVYLDKLGDDRWELVSIRNINTSSIELWFKRPATVRQ